MNYNTAAGRCEYGQHQSAFGSNGFSANNSYSHSRPSQPRDYFQYMRTGNQNMAPRRDHREQSRRPLLLTPSAFANHSQVDPARAFHNVKPDPDKYFRPQFETPNHNRFPMDSRRSCRPDYVRSGAYGKSEQQYGGRADRKDRSTPPVKRDSSGRRREYGSEQQGEYGSREGWRGDRSRDHSSSHRMQKRPREDREEEREQRREIEKERGDGRDMRSSSNRPVPVIGNSNGAGRSRSIMDRYGYAGSSGSQSHVHGGRGDTMASIDSPSSIGNPPSSTRSFPSKSTVGKEAAAKRRYSTRMGRNKFNLGDTSDDDDDPLTIPIVPGFFARTPSRSCSPVRVPPAAPAAPAAAAAAVIGSAAATVPTGLPGAVLYPPPPPILRPAPDYPRDYIDITSDDEERAKAQEEARAHVDMIIDGPGAQRVLPSRTGRFYESVYANMTSLSSPSAHRRVTVAARRSRANRKTTVADAGTVPPPQAGVVEGEDEYDEDTVATEQRREDTVDEPEDTVADENEGHYSSTNSQPMNSSTSTSPSYDDDDFRHSPGPRHSPVRRDSSQWLGRNGREDFYLNDVDEETIQAELNRARLPSPLPKLHPGIQGSKLIVDLMTGEAMIESQDGRKTGFSTLETMLINPRSDPAFNVLFDDKKPTQVDVDRRSRMYDFNPDNHFKEFSMTNAMIDALNSDWQRYDRFNEWTESGDVVMQAEVQMHRFAATEEWKDKEKRMRREQREEWGEWEEKKMEDEERESEQKRREELDRECFDDWVESMKKKTGEEERAKALRSMAARLMTMAETEDAGQRKKQERAREWRDQRKKEQAGRGPGGGESMEEEETTVDPAASTVDKEMEEQLESNKAMGDAVEKEVEEAPGTVPNGAKKSPIV